MSQRIVAGIASFTILGIALALANMAGPVALIPAIFLAYIAAKFAREALAL